MIRKLLPLLLVAGCATAPGQRRPTLHFGCEGQASQRDQFTAGRFLPTPSSMDVDLSGVIRWP